MAQPAAGANAPPRSDSGPPLSQLINVLLDDILGLMSDRVHLAALELKRARRALTQLIGMLLVAAILAATAWGALWGLLVFSATLYGVPWWAIGIGAILINVFGGWLAIRSAWAHAEFLTLPATLRRLTIAPSSSPATSHAEGRPQAAPQASARSRMDNPEPTHG